MRRVIDPGTDNPPSRLIAEAVGHLQKILLALQVKTPQARRVDLPSDRCGCLSFANRQITAACQKAKNPAVELVDLMRPLRPKRTSPSSDCAADDAAARGPTRQPLTAPEYEVFRKDAPSPSLKRAKQTPSELLRPMISQQRDQTRCRNGNRHDAINRVTPIAVRRYRPSPSWNRCRTAPRISTTRDLAKRRNGSRQPPEGSRTCRLPRRRD